MDKFFLKVLHEEPLDKLTLEEIKGGFSSECGIFSCKCNSVFNCKDNTTCGCNDTYMKPCFTLGS